MLQGVSVRKKKANRNSQSPDMKLIILANMDAQAELLN